MNGLSVAAAVAIGGALGALLRYAVMLAAGGLAGRLFYLATFAINVTGSFALGCLYALAQTRGVPAWLTGFVGVGVLGAYTTFSTFAVESLRLALAGRWVEAVGYVLASALCAIAAAWAGVRLIMQ